MKKLISISLIALMAITSCGNTPQKDSKISTFETLSKDVKGEFAPDRRDKTYEIEMKKVGNDYVLYGSTTEAAAKDALLLKLKESGITPLDSITLLPDAALGEKRFAVCALSVANLRYQADYSSEMATQILMGTPLKVLGKESYWYRVVTPEGYTAWVTAGSLSLMSEKEMNAWRDSERLIITTYYTLFREKASQDAQVISDGVWGDIVVKEGVSSSYYIVRLPNGKKGFLPKADAAPLNSWIANRELTPDNILSTGKHFLGFPYLWAGTSIKGLDCSGFVKTSFFLNGVILRRDASQQAKCGEDVDISTSGSNGVLTNLRGGDLLFFGRKATEDKPARITHVGIYIGGGEFIHAATSVRINSLVPEAANYYDGSSRLVSAKRYFGYEDKDPGIISISKHPWYFNLK